MDYLLVLEIEQSLFPIMRTVVLAAVIVVAFHRREAVAIAAAAMKLEVLAVEAPVVNLMMKKSRQVTKKVPLLPMDCISHQKKKAIWLVN